MFILRNGEKIELTPDEVLAAFEEQHEILAAQSVRAYLEIEGMDYNENTIKKLTDYMLEAKCRVYDKHVLEESEDFLFFETILDLNGIDLSDPEVMEEMRKEEEEEDDNENGGRSRRDGIIDIFGYFLQD